MPRHFPAVLLLLVLPVWLAASYCIRFALMEDGRWVAACLESGVQWECRTRAALGYLIHFRVMAWAALALALSGFFMSRRSGRVLAWLALFVGLPALVLYGASLAIFALVLAGLRLVRA